MAMSRAVACVAGVLLLHVVLVSNFARQAGRPRLSAARHLMEFTLLQFAQYQPHVVIVVLVLHDFPRGS